MDYEWYLRRCAEDEILAGEGTRLPLRIAALDAAGVLVAQRAEAVVESYRRAWSLRGRHEFERADHGPTPPVPPPPRVVALHHEFEEPWGRCALEYAVLTSSRTELAARIRDLQMSAHGHPVSPAIDVTDEHGVRRTVEFSGGGSDEWIGSFHFEPGLPVGTRSITVSGNEVPLPDVPTTATVRVEQRSAAGTPAARAAGYVQLLTESIDAWNGDDSLPTTCETYVACGILAADDPEITDALQTRATAHGSMSITGQWVARHHHHQPANVARIVPVGAVSPLVADTWVGVLALRLDGSGMSAEVESSRPLNAMPHEGNQPISISSVDDRGRTCAARVTGWTGGEDVSRSSVIFDGGPGPSAEWVEVVFGLASARVIVRVPLNGESS